MRYAQWTPQRMHACAAMYVATGEDAPAARVQRGRRRVRTLDQQQRHVVHRRVAALEPVGGTARGRTLLAQLTGAVEGGGELLCRRRRAEGLSEGREEAGRPGSPLSVDRRRDEQRGRVVASVDGQLEDRVAASGPRVAVLGPPLDTRLRTRVCPSIEQRSHLVESAGGSGHRQRRREGSGIASSERAHHSALLQALGEHAGSGVLSEEGAQAVQLVDGLRGSALVGQHHVTDAGSGQHGGGCEGQASWKRESAK